jgi:hypothetical protein
VHEKQRKNRGKRETLKNGAFAANADEIYAYGKIEKIPESVQRILKILVSGVRFTAWPPSVYPPNPGAWLTRSCPFFSFRRESEFLNSFATHLLSAFRIVAFKAHSITSPWRAPYWN